MMIKIGTRIGHNWVLQHFMAVDLPATSADWLKGLQLAAKGPLLALALAPVLQRWLAEEPEGQLLAVPRGFAVIEAAPAG